MLSRPSPLVRPPPTAARPSRHFPLPVIGGTSLPVPRRHGAETALPSSEANLATVPIPLCRGVLGHPLQDQRCRPWPSPCLATVRFVKSSVGRVPVSPGCDPVRWRDLGRGWPGRFGGVPWRCTLIYRDLGSFRVRQPRSHWRGGRGPASC